MSTKKIWIPIGLVLIALMGLGLYSGHRTANQEPIKIYKPTEPPAAIAKDGEERQDASTVEGIDLAQKGHFPSADTLSADTLHVDAHDILSDREVLAPVNETRRAEGVAVAFLKDVARLYPRFETSEEVQRFLTTASSEAIYARVRDMYVARHYKRYPDCENHEAILADAEGHAKWYMTDLEYRRIDEATYAEWKTVVQDRILPTNYRELVQLRDTLTDEEKAALVQRVNDWVTRLDTASKRRDDISRQRPMPPEPTHTH